ncbi:MAG: ABC transporter ATP-binding protein [Mucilaginibacter sp.]|nr:ABC transporter ATP-binding protein [Mucilaginibacter sp.]
MSSTQASIVFQDLSFGYNKSRQIFSDLSFTLKQENPSESGYVTAIMGSSGAGKTTLLKLILGIERQYGGTIRMLPSGAVHAYVPQEPVLFEHLSPLQNARYFEHLSVYKDRFDPVMFDILTDSLNLQDVLKQKMVTELSGGQKQRLSLLRALSIRPDFLFLDEPCTGLDADVKLHFLFKLKELAANHNIFLIYITHHHDEAELIADNLIYLTSPRSDTARQIFHGPIRDMLREPPHLDIEKSFKFPSLNVFKITSEDIISGFNAEGELKYFMSCEAANLSYCDNGGFSYRFISASHLYHQLLIHGNLINIRAAQNDEPTGCQVQINGMCNIYDKDGAYLKTITLAQNKIISNG